MSEQVWPLFFTKGQLRILGDDWCRRLMELLDEARERGQSFDGSHFLQNPNVAEEASDAA